MTCRICRSPNRNAVEADLLRGQTYRAVAAGHGIPPSTVYAHKAKCMARAVAAAVTYAETVQGLDTLATARSIVSNAERLGHLAEDESDIRTALLALREMARATELYAKLNGELAEAGPLVDPRFFRVRDAIMTALRPFPEAARAVFVALVDLEAAPRPALVEAPPTPRGDSAKS